MGTARYSSLLSAKTNCHCIRPHIGPRAHEIVPFRLFTQAQKANLLAPSFEGIEPACHLPFCEPEVRCMKSEYFRNRIGKILLALSFLIGVGLASTTAVQAQWGRNQDPYYRRDRDRDRDRDQDSRYRRDDRYGRNGGGYQVALNQGYQDGLNTGSNDAQRGQSYSPQRSHFYRNGHGNYGGYGNNGRYGDRYENQQAYRSGFLRGYDEGFRRYGGNNRRRNNGNYGRLPFPW